MFQMTVGRKIGVAFAGVLLLLLVIGFVSYRGTAKLIDTSERVAHTYKVIGQLHRLWGAFLEAESSQRAYLLTHATTYLQLHRAALGDLENAEKEIKPLTSDNEKQRSNLKKLAGLLKEKRDLFEEQIAASEKDKELKALGEMLLKSKARVLLEEIRGMVTAIESEERDLLDRRDREAREAEQATYWVIGLGTGLGVLVVALGGFVLVRSIT